jgi:hypothetical protein
VAQDKEGAVGEFAVLAGAGGESEAVVLGEQDGSESEEGG